MLNGTYAISSSNVTSVIAAASQGPPISMIAPGTFATGDADHDFSAVLVPAGSPIRTVEDLAGVTIAVNTRRNIGDVTVGLRGGNRAVLSPSVVAARPGMQIGSYVATEDYVRENPEVITAFRDGLADTAEAIATDPGALRAALPDLAGLEAGAAGDVQLPVWRAGVDVGSLRFVEGKMRDYGLLAGPVDVSSIVAGRTK